MVSIRPRGLRKERSFDDRVLLYEEVKKLALSGLTENEVRAEVQKRFDTGLDPKTVKGWIAGDYSPYGRVYRLPEAPIPDLAYLMGVNLGDTSRAKSSWHHNYTIRLRVTDGSFAREFSRAATAALHAKPFKVLFDRRRGLWQTEVNSFVGFSLVGQALE